jgi:hypothetical protein
MRNVLSIILVVVPHLELALVYLLPLLLALTHVAYDFCDCVRHDERDKDQEKRQTLRHDRNLPAR